MKIKKGDLVLVIKGKDRGKTGKVVLVEPELSRVKVAGINIMKRHTKARRGQPGGIIETVTSMDAAKVMIICQHCGNKPVRVSYKLSPSGGPKERICKVCKSIL